MSAHITVLDIDRVRGDTFPVQFTLTDENGVAVDISGFTFNWTVDIIEDPADELSQVFKIAGVIVTALSGIFEFRPTAVDMDLTPGSDFFHEVSMVDAGSFKRTIVKGRLIIEQDKDKD